MPCKCYWLDTVFGKCGLDADEALAFQTPKIVKINDRVLGLTSICIKLCIFVYIVFSLFIEQSYLLIETPTGTTNMNVQPPAFKDYMNAYESLPYCSRTKADLVSCPSCPTDGTHPALPEDPAFTFKSGIRMPCMFWDKSQYVVPSVGPNMLVTTRIKKTTVRLPCNKNFTEGLEAVDPQCIKDALQANVTYPEEQQTFKGFVAGSEHATVKIDHTVTAVHRELEMRLTDMNGQLESCDGSILKRMPKWDRGRYTILEDMFANRLFTLDMLLQAASTASGACGIKLDQPSLRELTGKELTDCRTKARAIGSGVQGVDASMCGDTVRYDGLVLVVSISYDNTRFMFNPHVWDPATSPDVMNHPEYSMSVKALTRTAPAIDRVSFVRHGAQDSVELEGRNGILIMVQQTGRIGQFDFKAMLINLTAGLGLLAVGNIITITIASTVCPFITGDARYSELLVQDSPDFNEDNEEPAKIIAKQNARTGQFKVGDVGNARWEKDGRTIEIKWPSGKSTYSLWPNEAWYEGQMPSPEDAESKKQQASLRQRSEMGTMPDVDGGGATTASLINADYQAPPDVAA